MLTIILPATEYLPTIEVQLEHSLVSLSKWESLNEKAFYSRDGMDKEETDSYIEQMILSSVPGENWVSRIPREDFRKIQDYINSKQTATWFREDPDRPGPREIVTAELIYYWMISFQIPFQPCETWHLNRLMTLIKVCGIKQTKPRKMSRQALAAETRRLNEQRRQQLGSAG